MAHSDDQRLDVCLENQRRYDNFIELHEIEKYTFRDRVKTLELKMELVEKAVMKNAIIGGIIGALIGSGASPAVIQIVDFFLKGH
jgi:hypothetical protein